MKKKDLILKFFQKSHILTPNNPNYAKMLSSFFLWMIKADDYQNDNTTKYLNFDFKKTARIISRQKLIVSGIEEITYLINTHTNLFFKPLVKDGSNIKKNESIAEISGDVKEMLSFERIILNILQRFCGISTATRNRANLVKNKIYITATRKTPWAMLDKKAVYIGGGLTHRLSLSDGILIKDNHIKIILDKYKLKNNISAVKKTLELILPKIKNELIEIEIEKYEQASKAIRTFNSMNLENHLALLFDNFHTQDAKTAIKKLRKNFNMSKIIIEASGGINEKNIKKWIETGIDIISMGELTHSPKSADVSMEMIK